MAAIANCVIALLNYPDVLKKAQEEIDRVIGFGNLPTFEDRSSLPYINAIAKESLRWRDTGPLGTVTSLRFLLLLMPSQLYLICRLPKMITKDTGSRKSLSLWVTLGK